MLRIILNTKPLVQRASYGVAWTKVARSLSTNETSQTTDANQASTSEPSNNQQTNNAEAMNKLHEEVKDLKDQLLRAYAEGENIRRIAHRDVENARAYANSSFAKAMLEISDDLERALSVVTPEQKANGDKTLKTLVDGIEMTEKNLQKVFHKFGVVRYGSVNDKFDPNIHDALFQIPDHQNEPDTVAQIVKMGYKIKDRVLRPAQVGTRVKPN
jgi:molecular chaperone GrpE